MLKVNYVLLLVHLKEILKEGCYHEKMSNMLMFLQHVLSPSFFPRLYIERQIEARKSRYMHVCMCELFYQELKLFCIFVVSRAAFREKTAEVSETGCTAKEVQMAIATVSNNAIDDDQPLSTWIGGVHSSATAEELRKLF